MEIVDHYLYTKEHEWINIEENMGTVGITDYAQSQLGDITFAELPEVDTEVEQFEEFVSVESVKAASDIYSPLAGRVVEINSKVANDPSIINRDCYVKGWLVKIEISDMDATSNLMTAEEYRQFLESLE